MSNSKAAIIFRKNMVCAAALLKEEVLTQAEYKQEVKKIRDNYKFAYALEQKDTEESPSPFKRSCSHLIQPAPEKVRLGKGRTLLPKVVYYFTDDLPISSGANIVLLPEGGWAEEYIGSPFATQRPLGHIATAQFEYAVIHPQIIDLATHV